MTTTIALSPPTQTPPATIEIDVQLQPIDLYRADRILVWRQIRWLVLAAAIFVLAFALMVGSIFLIVLAVAISLFFLAVHSGFAYMGARSMLRSSRVLRGTIHYSFEPSGLRTSGETFRSFQDWSNFHDVLETRHLFILRPSTSEKVVIPKRYLLGGHLEKVRALASKSAAPRHTPDYSTDTRTSDCLTATVRMEPNDLYQGYLTLLLRKSYWSATQIAFAFASFFVFNPHFLSPILFVAIGSLFFFYLGISLYRSSSRAIRTSVAYQNAATYFFGSSGLEAFGPTFSFHHAWCNFQSIIETSKLFLFCPSNAQMIILPKLSFTDPAQLVSLRQLLRDHFRGKLSLKH
jgi:hypothetical protein